uniref:Uncharacterized protein n=1 Tax=Leptobrachium leishanense TaxID=445787 RepID=A0A8C5P8I4_9ANUR
MFLARALITFPKANKPLLIWTDSLNLSPVFPVFVTLSEPARSTNKLITSSALSTSHSLAPTMTGIEQ